MKIGIFSDSHSKHRSIDTSNLNDVDIIICCGDITTRGYLSETEDFLYWFNELPGQKVFIAGNHDFLFEIREEKNKVLEKFPTIHYLEETSIEIGGLKIWGSPSNPVFFNWAFNDNYETRLKKWEEIPNDTHIVVTHTPPWGILDRVKHFNPNYNEEPNVGCKALRDRLKIVKPIINCFGHIHEAAGTVKIDDTLYINAAVLDENYYLTNPIQIVEIDI